MCVFVYVCVCVCVCVCGYRLAKFERWMNGTCILTPPQKIEGEEEPYIYSFMQDIVRNTEVLDLFQVINNNLKSTISCVQRYFVRYKKYKMVWRTLKDKVRFLATHCGYERYGCWRFV